MKKVLILLIYVITHILILFNQGLFWDDWSLFNMSEEGINFQFRESGIFVYGYMHNWLNSLDSPILWYRGLTFVLLLINGFLFYTILSKIKSSIISSHAFLITIIYIVVPLYLTRITISTFQYTLCYTLFIGGMSLFIQYIIKPSYALRLLSLLLFFISFTTNSIVFYIYPAITAIILIQNNPDFKLRNIIKLLARYWDFYLIPAVFWILKLKFMAPSGTFNSYNQITLNGILYLPRTLLQSFSNTFIGSFEYFFHVINDEFIYFISFLLLTGIIIFSIYRSKTISQLFLSNTENRRAKIMVILIGLALLVFGALPYALVNKVPKFYGYETRHQLLMLPGYALILTGLIELLIIHTARKFIYSVLLSGFMICHFHNYIGYQKSWFKQVSLMENFRNNPIVMNNTSFKVLDNTPELNATDRGLLDYELCGIMKYTFGDQTRYACISNKYYSNAIENWGITDKEQAESFNFRDFNPTHYKILIIIEKGEYELTPVQTIKLLIQEYMNKDSFHKNVAKVIKIDTHELSDLKKL